MAWKEVGASEGNLGTIVKWNVTGQIAEGVFEGRIQGKYGMLVSIRTHSGVMHYPEHTVLARKLSEVPVGSLVKIQYDGKGRGRSGTEYKNFTVAYDDSIIHSPAQFSPKKENTQESQDKYQELYSLLVASKGEAVAKIISSTTALSNDPVGAMRDALKQLGIEPLPF